jgi:CheY-like chemotaxis protein
MRVLIADDQPSVRFALKLVLKQQDIDVAGDVSDSGELLAWLKTNQADLLLLDWELPDLEGKKIIPILRARYPKRGLRLSLQEPMALFPKVTRRSIYSVYWQPSGEQTNTNNLVLARQLIC